MGHMDMTGWLQGQVFVQTVDEKEVESVSEFLKARGLNFQVLTLSERMVLDQTNPEASVTSDRFSIAIQLGGFPQVLAPVMSDLVQRVHGGSWDVEAPEDGPSQL
jgi:selenophosphate synthetase-related protein